MLWANSASWPIASSHQHQRNPYHALQYCTELLLLLCSELCMHAAAQLWYLTRRTNALTLVTASQSY